MSISRFSNIKDNYIFIALFTICLVYSLTSLSVGWNNPILDQHAFRQTQTAISTYYILQGGPWLAYETPVLGTPWAIPFEFPLYQWLIVALVKIFHTPLDQTGRFVSAFFFYCSLIPSYIILGNLKVHQYHRLIFFSLILSSPLYIFWSRTFMIESTALFFGLAYFASVSSYFQKKSIILIILASIFSVLGATIKVTTFLAFLLAALFSIGVHWKNNQGKNFNFTSDLVFPAIIFLLIPCIAVSIWTSFSDFQKLLNPIGASITSKALITWNFGTLEQRFSFRFFKTILRTIQDLFNQSFLPIIIPAVFLSPRKYRIAILERYKRLFLISILLFLVPIITFTNLHIIHNYYQYANGIFLISAISFCLLSLIEIGGAWKQLGISILVLILFFQTRVNWNNINNSIEDKFLLETATAVQQYTEPHSVLIIHGYTWSSALPYYSQRRALMNSSEMIRLPHDPLIQPSLKNLSKYKIGAMIFCFQQKSRSEIIDNAAEAYHFQKKPIFSNPSCQIHLPLSSRN